MSLEKHLETTCTHGPRDRSSLPAECPLQVATTLKLVFACRPDANKLYADIKAALEAMEEGEEKTQKKVSFDDMEAKLRSDDFAQEVDKFRSCCTCFESICTR